MFCIFNPENGVLKSYACRAWLTEMESWLLRGPELKACNYSRRVNSITRMTQGTGNKYLSFRNSFLSKIEMWEVYNTIWFKLIFYLFSI